jgi:hypothetical protein
MDYKKSLTGEGQHVFNTYWTVLWTALRTRTEALRREPEAGYTTEFVLVVALLAIAVVLIVTIIVTKIVTKANGIDLGQ